jgi:hypothetical protein
MHPVGFTILIPLYVVRANEFVAEQKCCMKEHNSKAIQELTTACRAFSTLPSNS